MLRKEKDDLFYWCSEDTDPEMAKWLLDNHDYYPSGRTWNKMKRNAFIHKIIPEKVIDFIIDALYKFKNNKSTKKSICMWEHIRIDTQVMTWGKRYRKLKKEKK